MCHMTCAVSLSLFFTLHPHRTRQIKPSSSKTKVDSFLPFFQKLESIFKRPKFVFLSETGLSQSIPVQEFTIPGYLPLITKHDSLNHCGHGVHIKNVFSYGKDPINKDVDFPFVWLCVVLVHNMLFIFSIVLIVLMFDQIAEKVDAILSDYSSAFIFGNFSVHHEK